MRAPPPIERKIWKKPNSNSPTPFTLPRISNFSRKHTTTWATPSFEQEKQPPIPNKKSLLGNNLFEATNTLSHSTKPTNMLKKTSTSSNAGWKNSNNNKTTTMKIRNPPNNNNPLQTLSPTRKIRRRKTTSLSLPQNLLPTKNKNKTKKTRRNRTNPIQKTPTPKLLNRNQKTKKKNLPPALSRHRPER